MNSNVGFELHGLQKLFVTSLSDSKVTGCWLDAVLIHELVVGEIARIKHCLIEKVLTMEGEDAVRRYVRIHQYAIVGIMDNLYKRRDQSGALECCDLLDGLLSFLNQHFPQYFDELGKAPLKQVHDMRIEIAGLFGLLEKRLSDTGVFGEFVLMILDPLHRFYSKAEWQRVSFHRLRFLQYVLEHSEKLVHDKLKADGIEQSFLDLLIYLNYNSRKTYMQLVQFVRDFLPPDLDSQSKRYTLCQYLKTTSQATVKPNSGYHPQAPTLKSRFIDYLNAELRDLVDDDDERPQEPTTDLTILNKAKFDLSVAQLGCLLRLLTDTGLLSTDNISALIRCVALNCETKKSRSISPESLRIKFYEIEDGTRRAVVEKLSNMMKSAQTF